MKPSSQEPGWQSAPAFMVALLLAAGAFWAQGTLESERPQSGSTGRDQQASQIPRVDARLWQDPFGAARLDASKHKKESGVVTIPATGSKTVPSISIVSNKDTGSTDATLSSILGQDPGKKCTTDKDCQVLGVMVIGGPYTGMEEHRRAIRYAVLAGLMEDGYQPTDSEHIRYVHHFAPDKKFKTLIPFEWLEKKEGGHLLLLWLDEEEFAAKNSGEGSVIERLGKVFKVFDESSWPRKILLGPISSATLKQMACVSSTASEGMKGMQIYSASATSGRAWNSVKECKDDAQASVKITRVTPTDEALVDMLVNELGEMRRVGKKRTPSDTVLLVAQRESSLTDYFKKKVQRGFVWVIFVIFA